MDKNYTLESIAELAGVSRATVSRVINNQKYVKEDIRKKVMDTINRVGYVPNAVAQSLASKRTNNIGVLVFGLDPYFLSNQVFFEIIQGIHEESLKNNYDLMLYSAQGKSNEICYKIIGKRMVDVLIVMGEKIDIELLQILYESDLSIILIGKRDIGDMDIPYVCSDYGRGAFTAVDYLVGKGLSKIAFLQCFKGLLHEQEKLDGYKRALRKSNILFDKDLVIEGGAQQDKAFDEVSKLLEKTPDIHGIFATSDLMAIGAIQAVQQMGKSVPDDISVVGFDDIASAHILSPALTTIRQDKRGLGENAVRIYNAIRNQEEVKSVVLDTKLIIRETTK